MDRTLVIVGCIAALAVAAGAVGIAVVRQMSARHEETEQTARQGGLWSFITGIVDRIMGGAKALAAA